MRTGHIVEATFKIWESEYLKLVFYVLMPAFLFQRGSAESKDPDRVESVDVDPRRFISRLDSPWIVRHGGRMVKHFENSLTIALSRLFLGLLVRHAAGGASTYSANRIAHGGSPVSTMRFLETAQIRFQSFQNRQS